MAQEMAQGGFVGGAAERFGAKEKSGDGGLHFGRRPETGGGDVFHGANVVVALEEDGEQAVILRGWSGFEAFGDFALDGHDDPGGRMGNGGQFNQQARGDGVRKISHELPAWAREEGREVAFEDIGMDQVQPGGTGKPFAEVGSQAVVLLHGGHGSDAFKQGLGENAEAGADFDDCIVRLEIGGAEQDVQDVAVDQEVLSEEARGMEIELRQEGADFRGARQIGGVGHLGIPSGAVNWYQSRKVGAAMREAEKKIWERGALAGECGRLRASGKRVVFTNGAFDLMHAGHATYLELARAQGDVLVVGLNTDASVRRYKGDKRPIVDEKNRARMMAALECVDYVTWFDEDEPKELIAELQPDVLVKAEDWAHYVSGRDIVEARGGKVVLAPMVEGLSTTKLIERVLAAYSGR